MHFVSAVSNNWINICWIYSPIYTSWDIINLMGLSKAKIRLLREFIDFTCEVCGYKEGEIRKDGKITSKLEPHRLRRGHAGGKYELRNIKMCCNSCHKNFHYKEF